MRYAILVLLVVACAIPLGLTGAPCANGDDCEGGACDLLWEGGYCTSVCASHDDCPLGEHCVLFYGNSDPYCYVTCYDESHCAAGFRCWWWFSPEGSCVPEETR